MIVRPVSPEEYRAKFGQPSIVYASTEFAELNLDKVQEVLYLASEHMGMIVGYDDGMWRMPMSAPYGWVEIRGNVSIGEVYDFFEEATHLLGAQLRVTLPPMLYASTAYSKLAGVLNALATKRYDDYNYHYPLPLSAPEIEGRMSAAARRNLRRAYQSGLTLETCDISTAYNIIDTHHKAKGYRMAMTCQQVIDTASVVPTDAFIVRHEGEDIAAVYLHHPTDATVQLINWGNLPDHELLRPMNFLASALALHYSDQGLRAFDLGPASTAGVPNAGLCRFKEEIGCELTLKPTFVV